MTRHLADMTLNLRRAEFFAHHFGTRRQGLRIYMAEAGRRAAYAELTDDAIAALRSEHPTLTDHWSLFVEAYRHERALTAKN